MSHEIFVISSSSDSDTDRNSDYDLPETSLFQRNKYSTIPTQINARTVPEHELSGRSSESEHSLPDISVPSVRKNVLAGTERLYTRIGEQELLWKCADLENNNAVTQTTSTESQQSSQGSSRSSTNSANISAVLELSLCQEKFYDALQSSLDSANISHTTEELPFEGMVVWKDSNRPGLVEDQVILFLNCSKVTNMVSNFKKNLAESEGDTLLHCAQEIFQKYCNSKISFILFGMEKYFRSHKSSQTREFRDVVSGDAPSQGNRKRRNKNLLPTITRVDLEEAIVDLQLQANVNVRLVENVSEFSEIIVSFTTSIKDAPRKRLKQQHNFSWHVHGDSVGTVKVGKDLGGLSQLWVQQLLQFHQVSKETALAIVFKYPSPQALLKAYQKCSSKNEASKLLENVKVRRGPELLFTRKRIGPELSYKIHALLTTRDPDEILHSVRE